MRHHLLLVGLLTWACSATRTTEAPAAQPDAVTAPPDDRVDASGEAPSDRDTGELRPDVDEPVADDIAVSLGDAVSRDTTEPPDAMADLPDILDDAIPFEDAAVPLDAPTPGDTGDVAAPPAPTAAALWQDLLAGLTVPNTITAAWDGPQCDATGCLVLTSDPGAATVTVVGPFTAWDPDLGIPTVPLPGTTGWRGALLPPVDAPTPYRLVIDGQWSADPQNRYVLFGGFGFDNALVPAGFGRLTRVTDVTSPQLGNTRDLFVYLPAPYFSEPSERFPVLYLQDGFNVFQNPQAPFGSWDVEVTLDALVASGEVEPLIVVGVDTHDREAEYVQAPLEPGGDAKAGSYADFLADTVRPLVDATFRTRSAAAITGIGGSSLGGLFALYAAWTRPDAFGRVAAFSSAFWVGEVAVGEAEGPSVRDLIALNTAALDPDDLRIYLDSGDTDEDGTHYAADGWWLTDWTRNALIREGWPTRPEWSTGGAGAPADLPATTSVSAVPHLVWSDQSVADWVGTPLLSVVGHGHQHNEAAWRVRFAGAIRFLYPAEPN